MACSRCGKCEGKVGFTISPDYAAFVELHGIPVTNERGELKVIIDSPCDWYDPVNKLCKHYEQRPKICREYFCDKAEREPMELTKEMLLERRHSLEADVIALNGAIQQIDWTLDKLDESVEESADDLGYEEPVE